MTEALRIAGRGSAGFEEGRRYAAAQKARVRFAAPESWAVAAAVLEALLACGKQDGNRIAAIGIGDEPLPLLAEVSEQARGGFVSPTKFPASSASATMGLVCITNGLRGPTLSLTMPSRRAIRIATLMARSWIAADVADACVVCWARGHGEAIRATGVVLSPSMDARSGTELDQDFDEMLAEVPA